ncbi:hypothetical protein TWF970_009244 [Orbilia oligospora]|uniref:F-box domain-containing protein n=1 Tax=Orbilia oligospora TaxID=2813651 RepID=A0A7C8R605_ORBOL|nr:hypothetical protein TWF970_009244 [Orbilia oligospora]
MEINGSENGMDGLDCFPAEVRTLILELLDLESLLKCHDVCHSWREHSLYETNYLPHVLDAYNQLTHGTRPLPADLRGSEKAQFLKELVKTSMSALPVFAECETLRDIAVVLHRLDKSWLSGSNTSFASLNRGEVHDAPILAVAIDARTGSIVTGDTGGVVAFWNASTGNCYHRCRFPINGTQWNWAVPYRIAIDGDIMVIGTPFGGAIVAIRNLSGGPDPFLKVAEIWTDGGQIASIRIEGTVCILGEVGQVSFWDLSRFVGNNDQAVTNLQVPNLMTIGTQNDVSPVHSLFYRESSLFVGLAGSGIQQIVSECGQALSPKKQLWELPPSHYILLVSGPEIPGIGDVGCSQLCPVGADGDILVSWADSSICRMSWTSKVEDELVWEPRSQFLIRVVDGPYKKTIAIHARGEKEICRIKPNAIEMFREDGILINRIPCNYGAISCVAVDPAFIVVGTREAAVCVYYFAPGRQVPAYGQGPSSSAATSTLRSPSLERKHTYKRKYREAMGMDLETPMVVGGTVIDPDRIRTTTATATKDISKSRPAKLATGPRANVKIPVPTP